MKEQRFTTLPEPVRRDQLRTAQQVEPEPEELLDELREVQWLLRSGAS
jgi:DnaJ-domain-containing protein 1